MTSSTYSKGGTKLLKGGTKLLKDGTKLLKGGTKLLKGGTKSLGWATGGASDPPPPLATGLVHILHGFTLEGGHHDIKDTDPDLIYSYRRKCSPCYSLCACVRCCPVDEVDEKEEAKVCVDLHAFMKSL